MQWHLDEKSALMKLLAAPKQDHGVAPEIINCASTRTIVVLKVVMAPRQEHTSPKQKQRCCLDESDVF